jgi:hypothetical protein
MSSIKEEVEKNFEDGAPNFTEFENLILDQLDIGGITDDDKEYLE